MNYKKEKEMNKETGGKGGIPPLLILLVIPACWYVFLKFIIPKLTAPLPSSLIFMYMALCIAVTFLYQTIFKDTSERFFGPIARFLGGGQGESIAKTAARWIVLIIIPLAAGKYVLGVVTPSSEAPLEQRVMHPAPPIEFVGTNNPFGDYEHWKDNDVLTGKGLFMAMCSPCHGPKLDGNGPEANGFNPRPASFMSSDTIVQLQNGFVFWRVKKGGPGLPIESMPWKSVMPRWETRLSDDLIWKITMWEYKGSNHKPRTWE